MKLSPFLTVSLASVAGWAVLLTARGRFWRAGVDAHLGALGDASGIRVEAIVPARDEAPTIGASLASLVGQRFSGDLRVTLVDDQSRDGTAVVGAAAVLGLAERDRLAVARARALVPPWTGKLSALDSGVQRVLSERGAPHYWLFADADIAHDADNVASLVAKARRDGLDLASLMVRLRCESAWESLLIPAFIFFFQKLYPFAWSNDARRTTAAAAGGCILLSHGALERIGGLARIADRLIDDCALAAEVKGSGGKIWLGLTDRTASIRPYADLASLWTMVKRTAFTQLERSYPAVGLAVAGMTLLYIVPPAAAIAGAVRRDRALAAAGVAAWCAMAFAYLPTLRLYRRGPLEGFALPLAALLYTAMTVDSAVAHARKRGGGWKGRTYSSPG